MVIALDPMRLDFILTGISEEVEVKTVVECSIPYIRI
jgi:hypothetical protein